MGCAMPRVSDDKGRSLFLAAIKACPSFPWHLNGGLWVGKLRP